MARSIVTTRGGTTPLDPIKLQHLRSNIRAIFSLMDDAKFDKISNKCKYSIVGCCKTLQFGTTHVSGSATTLLYTSQISGKHSELSLIAGNSLPPFQSQLVLFVVYCCSTFRWFVKVCYFEFCTLSNC